VVGAAPVASRRVVVVMVVDEGEAVAAWQASVIWRSSSSMVSPWCVALSHMSKKTDVRELRRACCSCRSSCSSRVSPLSSSGDSSESKETSSAAVGAAGGDRSRVAAADAPCMPALDKPASLSWPMRESGGCGGIASTAARFLGYAHVVLR
jgi:hypothetical protein